MTLTFNKRVRKVSGNLIITIPKETAEAGQIEEGDLLTIKINLVNAKPKSKDNIIKIKTEIPQELKEAIPRALNIMIQEYNELWISSTDIIDVIKYNKLCDLDKLGSKNIYIDIGEILVSMGFIQTKKITGIKHRLITSEKLKTMGV
jgi:bifunctional DNA-binding transcriptional regulator/antitoxin component of YhaV-PrlF toxin-antitoxin module